MLEPAQQIYAGDRLAIINGTTLLEPEIDNQDAAVLAGSHDAAVVRLGRQHPTRGPLLGAPDFVAGVEVVDAQVEVVGAGDHARVLAVEPEAADELAVAVEGFDFFAGLDFEFVGDGVVAARQHVLHVFGEFDGGEPAFFGAEFFHQFHLLDIPETRDAVAAGADEVFAAELHGVDWASVAGELAFGFEGGAVPDDDAGVFGAGDDVFAVEGDVEDAAAVALEALDGFVGVDVPDQEVRVGGAGDEDLFVVLQAENAGVVPLRRRVEDGVSVRSPVDAGGRDVEVRIVDRSQHLRSRRWLGVRASDDSLACEVIDIPYTNGAVTRARDDLLLVELDAVDAVGVPTKVYSFASVFRPCPPILLERHTCLVHSLPFLIWLVRASTADAADLN